MHHLVNYSQIMSPRPPLPRKVGGHDPPPQLLWERRPWFIGILHSWSVRIERIIRLGKNTRRPILTYFILSIGPKRTEQL